MAKSEAVLTVIAIRLAALVVAGLIMKTAAADHPHQETACIPERAVAEVQAPPASKPEADNIMRDMLLHD
jgi:hypothetical protein